MRAPRRFTLLAGSLSFAFALTVHSAGGVEVSAETSAAPPRTAASAQGGFVGDDTCLGCHDDRNKGYADTAHGQAANPRSPKAQQGCESCHGPGGKHVEDPSVPGSIRIFGRIPASDASETCLSCHSRDAHGFWQGSAH